MRTKNVREISSQQYDFNNRSKGTYQSKQNHRVTTFQEGTLNYLYYTIDHHAKRSGLGVV